MRIAIAFAAVMSAGACTTAIDGGEELPPYAETNAGCASGCHGADTTSAPPTSLSGGTDTSSVAVGAHRQHLSSQGSWHRAVACADCHVVPDVVGAAGHIDGDNKAELTFSMTASPAMWTGTSCTTKCHGATAWGGSNPAPTWTLVDGTQSTCGSCHGTPPPAPHPTEMNCASCHPTMEEGSLTFRDPA
ncbi:MAG: cytochrome family protein, partial [Deltaproteobacteria bacterium]|nr:cytochrome family protein [Deltaproteobacteria bacterium]